MNSDYRFKRGDVVVSFRGHDRNKFLVVTESFGDSVIVADGRTRPLEKAKMKHVRHVRFVAHSREIAEAIENGTLSDAEIRRVIGECDKSAVKKFR